MQEKIINRGYEIEEQVEEALSQRIFSDLNPYIQNIIMVDGVNGDSKEATLCIEKMENLRMLILSHFMTTLPCVAIGTLRQGKDGWKDSACLVQKNVPVLYIDVRARSLDLKKEVKELKKKVQQKKKKDRQNNVEKSEEKNAPICSEAKEENQRGLKTAEEPISTALGHENNLPEEQRTQSYLDVKTKGQPGWYAAKKYIDTVKHDDELSGEQNLAKELLAAAREYSEQEWQCLACHKRYDVLDTCRIAFWHSIWERVRTLLSPDGKIQVSDDDISIYKAIEVARTKTEAVSIYDKIELAKDPCQKPKDQVN